jgi:hypothetical protein
MDVSVYLMGVYCGCVDGAGDTALVRWLRDAWKATGKKLDMGKACIRFKKVDDLALDVLGEAIRRLPAEESVELYQRASRTAAGSKGDPS